MRWLIFMAVLTVSTPIHADEHQGRDLMSEALRLFMKGLMEEMDPAIDGLEGFLDDLSGYHPPEVLPNGDIIIRRRQPVEPAPGEDDEVEL